MATIREAISAKPDQKPADIKQKPAIDTHTFAKIYRLECSRRSEEPIHIDLYIALDAVWDAYLADDKDARDAINPKRRCICLPAEMVAEMYPSLPAGYYDAKDRNLNIYMSTPGSDGARINVIAALHRYAVKGPTPELAIDRTRWMLHRLEKVADMGWSKFYAQYQ